MLLCGIIDELQLETKLANPDANSLLSYFFCQATVAKLSNAQAILRGLIYMLVNKQQPPLRSHLQDKFKDTGEPRFSDAEAWPALCNILLDVLRDRSLQKVYLIVDALDECIEDQDKFFKFVQEANLSRVRWIISSRNNVTQSRKLDDSQSILSLELQENAKDVSRAIDAFITKRTSQIESLRDNPPLLQDVQQALHQKAEGTFLWVALVVQELENVDSWDVREIGRLRRKDPEYCQHVLLVATLAYRPLQLLELGVVAGLPDAISSNAENIRKIINKSGSFLTVSDETVSFVHQSAKDYLVSNASTIFPSGLAVGHCDIFQRSLDAMTRPYSGRTSLQRDIYGLSHPGTLIDNVQVPNPDPLASIRYSCEFWVDHLCFANGENPECSRELVDNENVSKFLREHLLHWLEVLSLMRKLSYGVASIRKLLLFAAQLRTDTAPGLMRVLKDAENPTSSEGRRVGFGRSHDRTIRLWDAATGAHQKTLEGHSSWVRAVTFSPDGRVVASGSGDRTIRLWDAATGAHQKTLEGHSGTTTIVVSG
ncbi:hypothetical protein N658DRAFT_484613 [Parathielavia hyrcaniae]|uniref:Nephrocystin 3-like N-terminal domain-containing protein n=1 Tax=Parathielavia hyrcaniae TaxID=113614 RepID=A0AAN6Q550_9PEZI|nr:hypothetical protein N658DRAFT_484613 [Parathielavia hyrcaniae]